MVINGIEWNVRRVAPYNAMLMHNDGLCALGACDRDTRTIYLNNKLTGSMLDRVITHEICHAFVFSYGIEMGRREEEFLCDFMSRYGAEVILESKKIERKISSLSSLKVN